MAHFIPGNLTELRETVAEALAAGEPLELIGGGSKRGLGRPLQTPRALDLSRLSGIRAYEPNELVLTAAAATPLAEIEQALNENRQMLAFEPPDWRSLMGSGASTPTLSGVLACNLSGPRRIAAGAARDHFLGFRGVNGRGEIFKAGGRVVKNVTGYDLPKLMAGSYGTLAALEEVTVKVLPRPETMCTILVRTPDPAACLAAALKAPHEISAAACLPPGIAAAGIGGVVALRLEGPAPSVAARREAVLHDLDAGADTLADAESREFWAAVGEAAPFAAHERMVWRVSVAPDRGIALAETLSRRLDMRWFLDWGGGLLWAAVAGAEDGGAAVLRAAIRGEDGRGTGHATLVRAPAALRRAVPVFEPQPPALAALSRRVKQSFDPCGIFNPGRMVEGV